MDLGTEPRRLDCPHCKEDITTKTNYKIGTITHLVALLMCSIACCCIPYCVGTCKDIEHECPTCGRVVGIYRRV